MRFIIVDDEPESLKHFFSLLIEDDDIEYKFFTGEHPNKIYSFISNNDIDCAFLDVNMPNIKGTDLAKELVKQNPHIKIVFVTGLSLTKDNLPSSIKNNVLGIINKPYSFNDVKKYFSQISSNQIVFKATTFGSFECFFNKDLVHFSSSKSKELFALLLVVSYKNQSLLMENAITSLWPDKDYDKAKILYRDSVWRLRKTLNDIGFECVTFGRANLTLNKQHIVCDYWDYMDKKIKKPNAPFLQNYDWAYDDYEIYFKD